MYPKPLVYPLDARPHLDPLIQPQPYPRIAIGRIPYGAADDHPTNGGDGRRPAVPPDAGRPDQADADKCGALQVLGDVPHVAVRVGGHVRAQILDGVTDRVEESGGDNEQEQAEVQEVLRDHWPTSRR